MRKVYIFSGLGVDKRVLEKIDFGDIEIEFVDWITPIHNESIQAYAKRISSNFDFKKPILIGLSFGGIMAVEISKLIDTKKVILIASAKNKNEIPFIYRTLGKLKLNRIIPTSLIQQPNIILYWMFGIKHKGDKNLLKKNIKRYRHTLYKMGYKRNSTLEKQQKSNKLCSYTWQFRQNFAY